MILTPSDEGASLGFEVPSSLRYCSEGSLTRPRSGLAGVCCAQVPVVALDRRRGCGVSHRGDGGGVFRRGTGSRGRRGRGRARRRRPWGARRTRRRRRRRAAGRHDQGHPAGRPGRHRRDRQRRSVRQRLRPVAGHRPARRRRSSTKATSSRRATSSSRSIRGRSRRRCSRPKPTSRATRRCSTRPKRSSTRDAANAEYQQADGASARPQLVERGIVSKDAGEQSRAAADATAGDVKADQAAVESAKAQLAAQQAAVDNAKVQLELHDRSASPIDGRTGNITVKVGNLVTANSTELMTIAQLAAGLRHVLGAGDAPAGRSSSTSRRRRRCRSPRRRRTAIREPVEGELTFVDNARRHDDRHDQAEGDVRQQGSPAVAGPVRARQPAAHDAHERDGRPEPGGADRAGRPVRLRRQAGLHRGAAAGHGRPARRRRSSSSIKGLRPGETVVTEGQLRLEQGTKVQTGRSERRAGGGGGRGGRGGRGRRRAGERGGSGRQASAGRPGAVEDAQSRQRHVNISEIFIRRPIATSLLMAAIALFGVVAYRALPVSDLPTVDYPTINVSASLPGGDPGTMASAVASPLERQFTTIAGLDEMTSRSGTGSTNVTLQFDLEPRHRQRRRRRADGDRGGDAAAAGRHAGAAVVPQAEPGRPADPAAQPDVEHAADVGARRLRGERARAAHLDGERRVAGAGAGRGRSTRCACRSIRTSCRRSRSASTRSIRRCRTGTSTCRPASCSARTRPTTSRPTAS